MSKKQVDIYTDGSSLGNPGPGGWAAVLLYNGSRKEISGGEPLTTNNRMELMAVIMALEALKESCQVNLHSDATYVVNAFLAEWTKKWKLNNFNNGKIKNQDLWLRLMDAVNRHSVTWIKVPAHQGVKENERCDVLAKAEAMKFT